MQKDHRINAGGEIKKRNDSGINRRAASDHNSVGNRAVTPAALCTKSRIGEEPDRGECGLALFKIACGIEIIERAVVD